MSRVVVTSSPSFGRYSEEPIEVLHQAGCQLRFVPPGDLPALHTALAEASGWITGFEPVGAATLDDAPNIRVVAKCGAGMDNFDHDYLRRRGIAAVSVPGGNAAAVAEYTMGQLIALARGTVSNDHSVRSGIWGPMVGRGLDGLTLGIVGFGAIGRRLGTLARAFGLTVIVSDPVVDGGAAAACGADVVSLPDLLARADVVTLHVPLTASTRYLIGAPEIELMRPGALLINNSRGGVVDESALIAALRSGRLGGAALDALESEPLPVGSPLLGVTNLLLSPHTAGYSDSALATVTLRCAAALIQALDGDR